MSISNNKKIIFFDGDGTVWYPGSTKRSKAPYWIYGDTNSVEINEKCFEKLVISDTALATLMELRRRNIKLVILSTHPHEYEVAQKVLGMKIGHLKLTDIFDEVLATDGRSESKGEEIVKILKKYKIPKSRALMVGDSYRYDYLSAKRVGVDAVLLESDYLKHPARGPKVKNLISEVEDVLNYCK